MLKFAQNTLSHTSCHVMLVEGDGSYIPASEDELMKFEPYSEDPEDEKFLRNALFDMDAENAERSLAIEDFPCSIDDSVLKNNGGALGCDIRQGLNQKIVDFIDVLDEDGGEHVRVTSSISPEFLLGKSSWDQSEVVNYSVDSFDSASGILCPGSSFAEPATNLVFDPRKECYFETATAAYPHQSTFSKSERDTAKVSKLPGTIIPLPEAKYDQSSICLENLTIRELHEAFRTTFGRETSVKDKRWLKRHISLGLHNFLVSENASSFLDGKVSSNESDEVKPYAFDNDSSEEICDSFAKVACKRDSADGSGVSRKRQGRKDSVTTHLQGVAKEGFGVSHVEETERALVGRKRLRKPTRRYIEESSEMKSRFRSGRTVTSLKDTRDDFLRIRSREKRYWKGFEGMTVVSRQDSLGGSGIQVPFVLRVRRGRPRKNCTSLLVHDAQDDKDRMLLSVVQDKIYSETHYDASDDCVATIRTAKGGIRRKHHRSWTLHEVVKLVEGVQRHGVGKWSDIKRLEFASSVYRTSVDLKDKWRNLLRASYAQLQTKKEVENKRKHASSVSIPASILKRVRELSVMYPKDHQHRPLTEQVNNRNAFMMGRSGGNVHKRLQCN
ncbi:uncharacterized protein LOC18422773 isoform X2 [Amborella trichopoda]|uniref:uncharacterized protein LOC18422773 isoform X2 n=1 Tax=Amborella trichopoda TaxID=13333 RepID=UPI0009BDB362|nr:uncharacterized protein LOC18422773 isoform X2 [Amborella trichopoda]|eukprot:XP_020526470.1 uncharacterized protein LOC18422773 isoform X2 [Amborella trichopoda]